MSPVGRGLGRPYRKMENLWYLGRFVRPSTMDPVQNILGEPEVREQDIQEATMLLHETLVMCQAVGLSKKEAVNSE